MSVKLERIDEPEALQRKQRLGVQGRDQQDGHDGGRVDLADGRQEPPQEANQPIGDAHDGIRHRIAKIGPDELE